MNRTKGILVLAALLAVTALLITRGTRATVIPPPIKPDPIVKPIPVARKGPVALGSSLSGSHLVLGGAGEAYLDISLDIAQPLVSKSAPVNVALVIDRSGSMAGKKLIHARAAARKLVTSLRTGDRLALITYGSDVTTVVPSAAITSHSRRRILAAIEEISDRGGTYLSGGFEAGRDELLNNQRAGALNRIILISDGQANEGITSTSSLSTMAGKALSAGIHLTTMGVGLNFN